MSNLEGEAQDRAAETRTGSGTGSQLESLDRKDPNVQSPAGLGPDNPHAAGGGDLGQAEMQARVDRINAEGRIGSSPDPTPDENYSLLTPPDAPTPETDAALRAAVDSNVRGNTLVNTGLTTAQTTAGAEPVESPGKTPGESQAQQPTPGATQTDDEQVQALVAQGFSEEDARAQVETWKGASQ